MNKGKIGGWQTVGRKLYNNGWNLPMHIASKDNTKEYSQLPIFQTCLQIWTLSRHRHKPHRSQCIHTSEISDAETHQIPIFQTSCNRSSETALFEATTDIASITWQARTSAFVSQTVCGHSRFQKSALLHCLNVW